MNRLLYSRYRKRNRFFFVKQEILLCRSAISVSYAAAEPVKEPTTYKNLFTLSEDEVYALIARVTLNAKKLEDDFRKAVGVALYDEPVDPRVKKLYAIDYDDYENYAEWYSEEEFWDLVDEYQYYIDSNTSY